MFYHPQDNKFTITIKHLAFWISLLAMFAMFIFLVGDDDKIPQKQVIVKIDIKNKVNICVPEEDFPKSSFFDF